jgi:hypothetical protein
MTLPAQPNHQKELDDLKEQERRLFRRVFMGDSTAQEGQYVLWSILKKCGLFITNTRSAEAALAMEARREIANYLLAQTNLYPDYKQDIEGMQVFELMRSFTNALNLAQVLKQPQTNPKGQ